MKAVGSAEDSLRGLVPKATESGSIKQKTEGETYTPTLPPYLVFRGRPEDQQKTIVITGIPRGGTTFASSIVARLGIPFSGGKDDAGLVGRLRVAKQK